MIYLLEYWLKSENGGASWNIYDMTDIVKHKYVDSELRKNEETDTIWYEMKKEADSPSEAFIIFLKELDKIADH